VEEILGVSEVVSRIYERLAERIFVGHRGDRRHLRDQPMRSDHPMLRIEDVEAVVVEGRQCPDDPTHHRHRMASGLENIQ
jgi:hypothetical protein